MELVSGQDRPRKRANDNGKVIVVTGGAGFLGSSLCRVLVDQGHRVVCIDNLISGRFENVSALMARSNFDFVRKDIIQPMHIVGPVDEIYNLACPASPPIYQRDPIYTLQTCVIGSMNMLSLALNKGARILQASTSEVYGDPDVSPQRESYHGNVSTSGPRACYDEGKRAAETLFHDYHRQHGVVTKIARIFNTYGPCMSPDDGRVVSNFVVQALSGNDLTVYGDGQQTRSFCYRDDLVEGLLRLMATPDDSTEAVNLGNPGEFRIIDLAEKVLAMSGSNSRIVHRALPTDDPHQRRPDISRAKALLDWEPSVALDEGLERTMDYFRDLLSAKPTAEVVAI